MARRASFSEQLDAALEAMMAAPNAPQTTADPRLRGLLEIASELTCRPTDEFKARLKADLQRQREDDSETDVASYRVEPHLSVRGAGAMIAFLQRAFAAEETARHLDSDGSIKHAEVRIGDSVISIGDADPGHLEPMPTAIHLYVPDADATWRRAVAAGATSIQEPMDQPYGDREGGVRDAFGNNWYIGTHKASAASRPSPHIPAGLKTINSYLHPRAVPELIRFLERAFGAEEAFRHEVEDGTVVHAKVRIGESVVEMGEAHGPYQPMPTVYHLYVDDVDAVYRRAVGAGGVSLAEPANQPWGMRNAGIRDPGGNQWWLNAPLPDAEPEERSQFGDLTPFLVVRDVRGTMRFLEQAFGAEMLLFDRGGDPPHDHAELRIGNSMMMMGEAITGFPPTSSAFYLKVEDVDAAYQRALAAGATSKQEPKQMPWGARMAHVVDPLGNTWYLAK